MATVLESLNASLHHAMESDPSVVLLGEDILDPYGGAFKVTKGLSSEFPNRVISTPVSEAGITGLAAGMALRGLKPVVEIMFGDFVTLIADQLINHITKFPFMYDHQVHVPIVIRTPMGGRRGYGPTHSQSLEKLFIGVPGLRALAPCSFFDPGSMLSHAILHDNDPVIFIENKLLYLSEVHNLKSLQDYSMILHNDHFHADGTNFRYPHIDTGISDTLDSTGIYTPSLTISIKDAPEAQITIATYGYCSDLAFKAQEMLAYQHEIFSELIVITQLSPVNIDPVLDSASRTGRLLVIEEGTLTLSWGAEVLARSLETLGNRLLIARRLASKDLPIPASPPLEASVVPNIEDIIESVNEMLL
ncbi:MAG: alpha-ketoacid dehydrogenase subunit beta [Anaerolineales bacterium]